MITDSLGRIFTRYIGAPIAGFLIRVGVKPSAITISGLLLSMLTGYLLALGAFLPGGLLLALGGLMDTLDGTLARMQGSASDKGAFLDSVVDRVSEAVVLMGLLWFYLSSGADKYENILVCLALVSSFLVSYMRARAEGLQLITNRGLMTRPERIFILVLGLLANQLLVALLVITVGSFFTAHQRFWSVIGTKKLRKLP